MEKGFTKEGYAFIKSVVTPSAQGRHRQLRRDGAIIERTKARGAGTYFNPSVSVKHNKLNTGFWNTIKNPYKNSKTLRPDFEYIASKEEITIQDWLEVKYDRPKGFFTSEKPDIFNRKGKEATFLQAFLYKLEDGVTVLDLDKERDHLMYLLALVSNKIANSVLEVNPLVHSHYIMEVNEGESDKARNFAKIEEAIATLYKLKNEYPEEMLKRISTVLGITKGVVTMESIKNRVGDYLLNKDTNQKENIEKFLSITSMVTGSKDKKELFNYMYFAKEFINYNIISYERGRYIWDSAPSDELKNLGFSNEDVVQVLSTNKEVFKLLLNSLEIKTGTKYLFNI
jgi:hypothetical protein